jgi:hypothetical protein
MSMLTGGIFLLQLEDEFDIDQVQPLQTPELVKEEQEEFLSSLSSLSW